MSTNKSNQPQLIFNKKPLLIPLLFIIIGSVLLFFYPNPIIQLIGGLLALLGVIVGFVLFSLVLNLYIGIRNKDEDKEIR